MMLQPFFCMLRQSDVISQLLFFLLNISNVMLQCDFPCYDNSNVIQMWSQQVC